MNNAAFNRDTHCQAVVMRACLSALSAIYLPVALSQ